MPSLNRKASFRGLGTTALSRGNQASIPECQSGAVSLSSAKDVSPHTRQLLATVRAVPALQMIARHLETPTLDEQPSTRAFTHAMAGMLYAVLGRDGPEALKHTQALRALGQVGQVYSVWAELLMGQAGAAGPGSELEQGLAPAAEAGSDLEVLGSGVGGWLQVRDTRTNIIGWSYGRYLESFPVRYPRAPPKKRGSSRKEAPEPKGSPKPTPKPM